MERSQASLRPVEFVVTRNPETRVIFAEYDRALIQVLTGGRPCHFVGTEHALWLFSRTFWNETSESFAEQATERCRSQASRVCRLEDRLDQLQAELERADERFRLERALRSGLEKELVSRDGFNRTQRKLAAIHDAAAAGRGHHAGAAR